MGKKLTSGKIKFGKKFGPETFEPQKILFKKNIVSAYGNFWCIN